MEDETVNYMISQQTDLRKPGHPVIFPDALLTPGDANAHVLRLTVLDNGTAANLNGCTASGYFERAGGTIIVSQGEIAGNVITVTFGKSCYAFPGRLRLLVRLADAGGNVITLADDLFRVGQGLGSEVIDESDLMMSLPELLSAVERLEAANTYAETFLNRVSILEKATTGSWFPAMQVGGISTEITSDSGRPPANLKKLRSV